MKRTPINYTITHPDGHIYVMPNLDSFLKSRHKTQKELKKAGWKIKANYAKSEI
ncbi:hypothetical protein [Pseudorhodobacter turbinis]|uniref:hypothetical protein n=1 Tax=Pseudorhodobacter turbinis TaxID=2500533 RepID=UPI00143D58D3|nr:hypothetical protein [Pseudorhodobacter turbinis]